MTNLNDMTFESPAPRGGTACDLGHGPDCIGHAWRVSDLVTRVTGPYAVLTGEEIDRHDALKQVRDMVRLSQWSPNVR